MMRAVYAMMIVACAGPATANLAQAARQAMPPPAIDFMVGAVQALCRPDGDKLEIAARIAASGWRLTDRADHYDKDFGVDAPVPLHDQHERGWRGPLANGRASLSIRTTDYRDPANRDRFSASFMASPEAVIDLEVLQRRLGMTLRPMRPAHAGRSSSYSAVTINGRPGPTIPAQYGQMQHFTLEPAPTGVEINGTRTWGTGYPEQWLRITCGTRFENPGS